MRSFAGITTANVISRASSRSIRVRRWWTRSGGGAPRSYATFAAIAASGDVNVNAIAPGTAAALAATVAGLLVAIPCLFGYNWLNTRIKAITTENRVFTDEVVTRIAEQFSA